MSQPSHYQDYVAIATVQDVIRKSPQLTWVPVVVDDAEPTYLAVALPGPPPAAVLRPGAPTPACCVWLSLMPRSPGLPAA